MSQEVEFEPLTAQKLSESLFDIQPVVGGGGFAFTKMDRVLDPSHLHFQTITEDVSTRSPFVPTTRSNAGRRAARFIIEVGKAIQQLHGRGYCVEDENAVKLFKRQELTAWDKHDTHPGLALKSTEGLSIFGTMNLGISEDDWPPCNTASWRPFQYVWTHFPEAKGKYYANGSSLISPKGNTLSRLKQDMTAQVGFTMDIMLDAHNLGAAAAKRSVAMVFNPVGAGAFIDRLTNDDQKDCMVAIMESIVGALASRIRSGSRCVLFITGSTDKSNSSLSWKNKCGVEATIHIPPLLQKVIVIGSFDCLTLAQELANLGCFDNVGVTMAADKTRIGNMWLKVRKSRGADSRLEFSAQNASDENNSRRSSLVPWILFINAHTFRWENLSAADMTAVKHVIALAEDFLGNASPSSYDKMMLAFENLENKERNGCLGKAFSGKNKLPLRSTNVTTIDLKTGSDFKMNVLSAKFVRSCAYAGRGHTEYEIEITTFVGSTYTIRKRYREMRKFFLTLPLCTRLPPFPAKRICGSLNASFVEARQHGLQEFFAKLAALAKKDEEIRNVLLTSSGEQFWQPTFE